MAVCIAVGVGQDEESAPVVGRADFSRREHARSNPEAQSLKVSGDHVEAKRKVSGDVFEHDAGWRTFGDDSGDLGPKVAGIGCTQAMSGLAEGLAGVSRREDIHAATPRAAVEGAKVVPDRSLTQGLVCHPRHESGRRT